MAGSAPDFGFVDEMDGHGVGSGYTSPHQQPLNSPYDPIEIQAGMYFALET